MDVKDAFQYATDCERAALSKDKAKVLGEMDRRVSLYEYSADVIIGMELCVFKRLKPQESKETRKILLQIAKNCTDANTTISNRNDRDVIWRFMPDVNGGSQKIADYSRVLPSTAKTTDAIPQPTTVMKATMRLHKDAWQLQLSILRGQADLQKLVDLFRESDNLRSAAQSTLTTI
jgi:hypothetical protein